MAIARATGGGEEFPICPTGLSQAVCVDVVDDGLVEEVWEGKTKDVPKVTFVFQVDSRDDDGKPVRRTDGAMFLIFAKFTKSLSDNANLTRFLGNWLGKPIDPEVRANGVDLDTLIGRNAQVTITHNHSKKNNRTYANIGGILPIAKNTPKLPISDNYVRVQDRPGYTPPRGSDAWNAQQEALNAGKYPDELPGDPFGDDGGDDDMPF